MTTRPLLSALARRAALIFLVAIEIPCIVHADPLHALGSGETWRHEFSGWLFPIEVAGLLRTDPPWSLEGGNDAGVRYASASGDIDLAIEILAAADQAEADHGTPFPIPDASGIRGTREDSRIEGARRVHCYRFSKDAWTVVVTVSTSRPGESATHAMDRVVRALPWASLGSDDRLH